MNIGIIAPMQEEYNSIVDTLQLNTVSISCTKGKLCIYHTQYLGHNIYLALSGISKVNAAACTQFVIDNTQAEHIFNIGTAGGLAAYLTLGDVVLATDLVECDVDVTAFGIPLGQVPRMDVFAFPVDEHLLSLVRHIKLPASNNIYTGRIITSDTFISSKSRAQELASAFNAIACEMEGASVAHTCYLNNVPCTIIRSIADKATDDAHVTTKHNTPMASNMASVVLKQLLDLY